MMFLLKVYLLTKYKTQLLRSKNPFPLHKKNVICYNLLLTEYLLARKLPLMSKIRRHYRKNPNFEENEANFA